MYTIEKAAGAGVFLLSAAYYFLNRFGGLAFIDSGELALASYTLGIPHPTGYPLYIILTRPITLFFSRPIEAVTVFSGLLSGLTVFLFFRLILYIIRDSILKRGVRILAAVIFSLIFALSPVIAAQGTTNEVYGLSLLINLVILFSIMKYIETTPGPGSFRYLLLISYLSGLTLANHLQGIIFIPILIYLIVRHFRKNVNFSSLVIPALALVLPITLYAVLAIRAASIPPPVANWGDLTSWDRFYRHVTGWQYRVWMFSGNISELWYNLKTVLTLFWRQLPPLLWLFLPLGSYLLFNSRRQLSLIIGALMMINLVIGINYSIPDNEGYFLVTITLLILMTLYGLANAARLTKIQPVVMIAAGIFLAWQVALTFNDNYRRDYTLPEDYAVNIARSAGYEALVMSSIWDHHGQLYYLQQAEYFRPDLKLVDMELLRRSWYFKLLSHLYPETSRQISSLVPPFLAELKYFETGKEFDADTLEYYFQKIINRLLTSGGLAYIDYGLNYTPEEKHFYRPQGLLMRVDTTETADSLARPELEWSGRKFSEYSDWRARNHIKAIKFFKH